MENGSDDLDRDLPAHHVAGTLTLSLDGCTTVAAAPAYFADHSYRSSGYDVSYTATVAKTAQELAATVTRVIKKAITLLA